MIVGGAAASGDAPGARRRRAAVPVVALAALVAALATAPPSAALPVQPPADGVGASAGSPLAALAAVDTTALRRTLDSLADAHRGVVGYAVRNLETGERLERRGDETFPTASLIKVPVLVTVFDLVERGQLSLDDPLTVLRLDQVPGSGVLQRFRPGSQITVGDAAWLMIIVSDNTATNLLLDRIIIRRVWEKMEALGLPHTKVHSKSFLRSSSVAMDSSVKYGLGVTTPNEMADLFALLAEGRAVSPAADSAMLGILGATQDASLLQRRISGVRSAHKTGATDSVRTECALWHVPDRVVGCVLTKENADTRWVLDTEPQLLMSRMGAAIVGAWRREAPGR